MMREYLRTKEEYPDCILMYRVGDFFEMFMDDAVKASRILELVLTGKDCGLEERAPMCGVPFHALDTYVDRLVKAGKKVAVCDQTEDPKLAKGLVRREVVRVVTPGTNMSEGALDSDRHCYLMCIYASGQEDGIAAADISTGTFYVTETADPRELRDEIARLSPAEILCSPAVLMQDLPVKENAERAGVAFNTLDEWMFSADAAREAVCGHFHTADVRGLGLDPFPLSVNAAGALLRYLHDTQKYALTQIRRIVPYKTDERMVLDAAAVRNLELCETLRDKRKTGSLLWVLDHTGTAMGARKLRDWIMSPLRSPEKITARYDVIDALLSDAVMLEELREALQPVYDLERLSGRIAAGTAGPPEMISLKGSLSRIPDIRSLLCGSGKDVLVTLGDGLDPLGDVADLIGRTLKDDPSPGVREGGIIRDGFNPEVDECRAARTEGTTWLAKLEEEERRKTGISTLRVKYNRVFGYCIEVTNTNRELVPDRYTRKQTLANAERYTTPELKELEDRILGAQDRLYSLEYDLFCALREETASHIGRIQETADRIAVIDALCSLAYTARRNRYVRPVLRDDGEIHITAGRHPVVEKTIGAGLFIPNDTHLGEEGGFISVITGPNMAGKSTYMRQTALIVLMAQMGSFVPADEASVSPADRIFTRVGASDDLGSGQSTFMVEMTEVAAILRGATSRSLLILDEIGRGTSTFDGLSIAWAVIEYIADRKRIGAKTLFATHYHELTELEGKIPGVRNYCIAVRERGDDILFLRKIVRGGADRSYGIQVARLAGVPDEVISRAKELSARLSEADIISGMRDGGEPKEKAPEEFSGREEKLYQLSLFDPPEEDPVVEKIRRVSVDTMTPLDALVFLERLKKELTPQEQDKGLI